MDTKTFHTSSAQCQFLLKAFSFSIKLSTLTGIFCLHLFIRRLYFPRNAISPAVSGFVSDHGGVYASNTPLETLQIKNGAMTNALRAANLLQKESLRACLIKERVTFTDLIFSLPHHLADKSLRKGLCSVDHDFLIPFWKMWALEEMY